MSRSIWNGTIAFGVVRIPVKLYSATEPGRVPLYEVHLSDGAPIKHRRYCTAEDREIPYSEVVKGYEVGDGEYVVLEREEIKAAAADRGRTLEIDEFVQASDIDPVFHDKTYYVGYRDDPGAYSLFSEALRRTGRAGIGRFSFHNREYLAAVAATGPVVTLHTLRFHDEMIAPDEVRVEGPAKDPTKRERELARRLIDSLRESFDPGSYADTHREALMDLIEAKAGGEAIELARPAPREATEDLAGALEASLAS